MRAFDTAARPMNYGPDPYRSDDGTAPTGQADPIAAAVRACPAVTGLHAGRLGQVTTYLPGRRVAGVAVSTDEIVVG